MAIRQGPHRVGFRPVGDFPATPADVGKTLADPEAPKRRNEVVTPPPSRASKTHEELSLSAMRSKHFGPRGFLPGHQKIGPFNKLSEKVVTFFATRLPEITMAAEVKAPYPCAAASRGCRRPPCGTIVASAI
jgi:hypothetical protein